MDFMSILNPVSSIVNAWSTVKGVKDSIKTKGVNYQ